MGTVTLDHVTRLAEQLSTHERAMLVVRLQASLESGESTPVTRETLVAELEELRAVGAFQGRESLYGKYANPSVPDISADELHAQLRDIASGWEQDLDTFDPNAV